MKKISILFLTILTINLAVPLFLAKNSSAMHQDGDDTWWSVEELLDFAQFAEREEEELCGNDFGCREELFYSRFESEDSRYQALDMLYEGRFWITSVNPEEETLEILYFDEDQMLKRWGINEIQPLEFIFLAWFDQINGQIGNYNHHLPIESQFSNDLHLLYANSTESYGVEGFPANIPFSLPIQKTNLKDNNLGYLYLAIFGENYNSKGYLDYSSCLKDYEEGMTCELMFSPGRGYRYFPLQETILENEQDETEFITEEILKEDGNEIATLEINDTDTVEESKGVGDLDESKDIKTIKDTKEVKSAVKNLETNSPINSIKAPDTGAKSCEKVIEFPWWLGVLIIFGNIVFLWFFGPNFKKTFIKPLDKKLRVR